MKCCAVRDSLLQRCRPDCSQDTMLLGVEHTDLLTQIFLQSSSVRDIVAFSCVNKAAQQALKDDEGELLTLRPKSIAS